MDNDDALIGRVLSRREVMALFGAAGAALVVGCSNDDSPEPTPESATTATATQSPAGAAAPTPAAGVTGATATAVPACVVIPELTEGPYFVDTGLDRADIRPDPASGAAVEGTPMTLALNVLAVSAGGCEPLEGAIVDVWHCDALGAYSGFSDPRQGFNTVGEQWLRGFQTTDAGGRVEFMTIYPGWYEGRATHIHFKVRKDNLEFTSQWFFDDALSDAVHDNEAPYSDKGASGRQQNDNDSIYRDSEGLLQLNVEPSGVGYAASFDIGIQV
jgi:protocatechuate 3,4-dioxygenase beta subunit